MLRESGVTVVEPPKTVVKKEVEILKEARKLIEKGWVRGSYKVERGRPNEPRYCLVGGLRQASVNLGGSNTYARSSPLCKAHDLLTSEMDFRYQSLVSWNDSFATGQADVLDLLDRTIDKAERGQ